MGFAMHIFAQLYHMVGGLPSVTTVAEFGNIGGVWSEITLTAEPNQT